MLKLKTLSKMRSKGATLWSVCLIHAVGLPVRSLSDLVCPPLPSHFVHLTFLPPTPKGADSLRGAPGSAWGALTRPTTHAWSTGRLSTLGLRAKGLSGQLWLLLRGSFPWERQVQGPFFGQGPCLLQQSQGWLPTRVFGPHLSPGGKQ